MVLNFNFVGMIAVATTIAVFTATPRAAAAQSECREWHECRQLALDAYTRGEYERFHDLAWRTVQTGPARDPNLLYLLARAQSLSGRPHDALVMLGRLLDMGFRSDAATNGDFRAARQLPQWPELEARMAPAGTPAPPAPVVATPAPSAPVSTDVALRVPGTGLRSTGLAYDRVSSRFVVADGQARKLVILDERSHQGVDLVTSVSAGFFDITALEIDPLRGDLWAVSAEAPGTATARPPATALHKLQLVSGRPLERILVPDALQPARLGDVAVTPNGTVLALDTIGRRILRLGAHNLTVTATLQLDGASSLAPVDDRTVYVAYAGGIARVEIPSGVVTSVTGSPDLQLGGLERVRWARDSLLGVQRLSDGSRRSVRIRFVNGSPVSITVIEGIVSPSAINAATVSEDEFFFVVQPGSNSQDVVIRRARLR